MGSRPTRSTRSSAQWRIDRTYYAPLPAAALQSFAEQVPEDFRFVVKAHEDCTFVRFPSHARYGKKAGEVNPRYLDAAYATEAVVAPFREGLGPKGGVLLFQFPPQAVGEPRAFAEQLGEFLVRLPKDVTYAVEIRNPLLLTREYAASLEEARAVHCHNAWAAMPSIPRQARQYPPPVRGGRSSSAGSCGEAIPSREPGRAMRHSAASSMKIPPTARSSRT